MILHVIGAHDRLVRRDLDALILRAPQPGPRIAPERVQVAVDPAADGLEPIAGPGDVGIAGVAAGERQSVAAGAPITP